MPKKIIIISLLLAILGLFAEIGITYYDSNRWLFYIKELFSLFNLYDVREIVERGSSNTNYTNVFFYMLLLLGALLYARAYKESRLIRFVFSVVLFSKIVLLAIALLIMLGSTKIFATGIAYDLIFFTSNGLWIFISFWILRYFNSQKVFRTMTREYGDPEHHILVEATRWQRFFNLVVDLCVMLLVYIPMMQYLARIEDFRNFLAPLEGVGEGRLTLYLLLILARTIYYMFFEAFFNATPAKFLSETRVTDESGNPPKVKNVAGRTFARFVPFEALSFFGAHGWHDKWSDTYVLQEQRDGVKGSRYFLIFPVLLVIGIATYFGFEEYRRMQYRALYNARFNAKAAQLSDGIKNISTNSLITIREDQHSESIYLKAEIVNADAITFTMFTRENTTPEDYFLDTEGYYLSRKDSLQKVVIKMDDLLRAVPTDHDVDEYELGERSGRDLFKDGKAYYVVAVDALFMPSITIEEIEEPEHMPDNIRLVLANKGWKAEIVKINNIKGDIKWGGNLPVMLEQNKTYSRTELLGSVEDLDDLEVQLVVKDTLGRLFNYTITGTGNFGDAAIKRTK